MGRVVAGIGLVLTALLAGCDGGDDSGGLPTLGSDSSSPSQSTGTPTTTSSATPTAPASAPSTPVTDGPTSPPVGPPAKTVVVHRRNVAATTAEQKAAADAFLQYLVVRLRAYHFASVDSDALGRVATGKAIAVVKGYVTELQGRKQHTIGEVWVDVSSVAVKGATATVKSCMDNTSIDVDKAGKPVQTLDPYYTATATLQKAGGEIWLVDNVAFVKQRCR